MMRVPSYRSQIYLRRMCYNRVDVAFSILATDSKNPSRMHWFWADSQSCCVFMTVTRQSPGEGGAQSMGTKSRCLNFSFG